MSINVVVLTGAGISAESGLGTFRAADGLWEARIALRMWRHRRPLCETPVLVHDFYNARRRQLRDVEPNAAHWALAEFEKAHDGDFLLITQNVDDLHKRAGSRQLASMHGDLLSMRCLACGHRCKNPRGFIGGGRLSIMQSIGRFASRHRLVR